jgi:O-antigen/teichoic acid export membrane protein
MRSSGAEREVQAISRRTVVALLDQAIVSIASFVALVMIGRVCGAKALGDYTLGITVVIFASAVHEALVSSPYTILGASRNPDERRRFASGMLWLNSVLSLGFVGLIVLTGWVAGLASNDLVSGSSAWLLLFVVPFTLLRELGRRFSYAHLNPGAALALDTGTAVLHVGSMLALAASGCLSATTGLVSLAFACGICGILWLGSHRSIFSMQIAETLTDVRDALRLGWWILAARVVSVFHGQVLFWILALRFGSESTGLFSAGMSIANLANPFVQGLAILIGPQASNTYVQQGLQGLRRLIGVTLFVTVIAMSIYWLVITLGAGWLMQIFYKTLYPEGHAMVVSLLALNMLFVAMRVCGHNGLTIIGRTSISLWINMISLFVTIALAIPMTGNSSSIVASIALLGGNVIGSILQLSAFYRASTSKMCVKQQNASSN